MKFSLFPQVIFIFFHLKVVEPPPLQKCERIKAGILLNITREKEKKKKTPPSAAQALLQASLQEPTMSKRSDNMEFRHGCVRKCLGDGHQWRWIAGGRVHGNPHCRWAPIFLFYLLKLTDLIFCSNPRLSFRSSNETISQPGIEPPASPFGLGTSPAVTLVV